MKTRGYRQTPDMSVESPKDTKIIDEIFHLKDFREIWQEAVKKLNIKLLGEKPRAKLTVSKVYGKYGPWKKKLMF